MLCSVDIEHHLIFECERVQALRNEAAKFTPGMLRSTHCAQTVLIRAQGFGRRFKESDPHVVMHLVVSRCMNHLDSEDHTHDEVS